MSKSKKENEGTKLNQNGNRSRNSKKLGGKDNNTSKGKERE